MPEKDCWSLLENEAFVHWVLHPDSGSDLYWEAWIRQDPQRAPSVAKAREFLLKIREAVSRGAGRSVDTSREGLPAEIWKNIQAELQKDAAPVVSMRGRATRRWTVAAAVAIIILGWGSARWFTGRQARQTPLAEKVKAATVGTHAILAYSNTSAKSQKVYLVDGSVVTLSPHSALSYQRFLNGQNREVNLTGSAFFEIAKDANHPFLVRSGAIVTQVLGTSFRVTADPMKEDIHVAVRTGKVSVYRTSDFEKGNSAFCVLLPHQEAVFHKKNQNMAFVPNADEQLLVPPVAEPISMDFDDAPVISILEQLQKMYHIQILFNKDSLQQCRLTAPLQKEKLNDKLDIICKAINASYHIQDDVIVIDGGRCP